MESLVSAGLYPPRVSYIVHRTNAHALNPVPLKCRIDVKGVEKPLYFMLTSPPQTFTTAKPCKCIDVICCLRSCMYGMTIFICYCMHAHSGLNPGVQWILACVDNSIFFAV